MQQLTPNVYTETEIRGCDPSMVLTKEGAVFIDTAQWITNLEQMIAFAEEKVGCVKYLINTESHILMKYNIITHTLLSLSYRATNTHLILFFIFIISFFFLFYIIF